MSKSNFEDCIFDVNKFGGKISIENAYPELLAYKEYLSIPSHIWKIAILSVDMGSPYSRIKDMNKKVPAIFNELSLDKNNNKKLFQEAMNHAQGDLTDLCTFLIEYQNDTEFATWYEKCKSFYETMRLLKEPMPDKENEDKYYDRKEKRQDRLSKLSAEIKELDIKLFGSVAQKNAAYRSKQKMERNYTEKYATENQVE